MPRKRKPRRHVGWRMTARVDENGELIVEEQKLYDDDVRAQETEWATQPVIEFSSGADAERPA